MALDAIINRKETSWWRDFQQAPFPALAKKLYSWRRRIALNEVSRKGPESVDDITVVCTSDTHNSQPKIPPGDTLSHAGDLTQGGTAAELLTQLNWLDAQPHAHKIVIAGNHDIVLDAAKSKEFGFASEARQSIQWGTLIYLEKSACKVDVRGRTVTIYGHPWTRKQGNWAFQYDKGTDVFRDQVPTNVDILATHTPPQHHLDVAEWGEPFLLQEFERVKPKLHVFGHIHAGYGKDVLVFDEFERLYQDVSSRRGGSLAIFRMVYRLLLTYITGLPQDVRKTTLINASAVGGLRDETQKRLNPKLSETSQDASPDTKGQIFFQHFLDAVGSRRTARYSVLETLFLRPDVPFLDTGYKADTPIGYLGDKLISQRLTQLINTFLLATTAPYAMFGSVRYIENIDVSSDSAVTEIGSMRNVRIETSSEVLRCHKAWAACLICISLLLIVAGMANAVLDLHRKAPSILDDFVSLLRDNPYAKLPRITSTDDSVDLARRYQHTLVRIGDVKPEDSLGYIAVATLSDSRHAERLRSKPLYA